MSVTPSPHTKPVQTSSAMAKERLTATTYFAHQHLARAEANARRVEKYGAKRTAAVDTGIFLMCLFPPAAIAFGIGKLAWDLAHTSKPDTY